MSAQAPAPSAAPAAGAPPTVRAAPAAAITPSGATTRGQAIVVAHETTFRIAPNPLASLIQTLPTDAVVTLSGQYNGLWVSVTTADSVLPGWILGTDLRRLNPASATAVVSSTGDLMPAPTRVPAAPAPAQAPTPAPAATQTIAVHPIAPLPLDPSPAPVPRASLTVTVTVVSAVTPAGPPPASSARTPTPTPATPRVGVRVQLVTAFRERLAEAVTGPSGQVVFTHDYAASSTLFIRLPAAGVELPIDPRQPAITIALPIGETP